MRRAPPPAARCAAAQAARAGGTLPPPPQHRWRGRRCRSAPGRRPCSRRRRICRSRRRTTGRRSTARGGVASSRSAPPPPPPAACTRRRSRRRCTPPRRRCRLAGRSDRHAALDAEYGAARVFQPARERTRSWTHCLRTFAPVLSPPLTLVCTRCRPPTRALPRTGLPLAGGRRRRQTHPLPAGGHIALSTPRGGFLCHVTGWGGGESHRGG